MSVAARSPAVHVLFGLSAVVLLGAAGCGGGGADGGGEAGSSLDGREPPAESLATGAAGRDATAGEQGEADAAPPTIGRYFIRLRPSADPDSVVRRHDLDPIEVMRGRMKAIYAPITAVQRASLEADTMVVSLAVELDDVPEDLETRIRGVEPR